MTEARRERRIWRDTGEDAADEIAYHLEMRERDFRERGLIVSDNVEEYDGTTAVVRTAHLDAEEVEFLRWRAERWMKVRHLPVALMHDPGFVLRHVFDMMRHTFRGCTLKTWLGLETERDAFRRYREIRRRERDYLADLAATTI